MANLLTNAAKYTDPGGHLRVQARTEAGTLVLQVSDDGIGIAPELLPHVFDLFFQARQGSDRALGGLGLGLALVRSLVELHGGTVGAESPGPGQGSTFTVRLPLLASRETRAVGADRTRGGAARASAAGPAADAGGGRQRGRRRESARILRPALGHEVQVAHDGAGRAFASPSERPPDLALAGHRPAGDGRATSSPGSSAAVAPDAYLVAATGYGQETDRRAAREAGFDRHLVKPLGVDELETLVHEQELRRAAERARESLAGAPCGAPGQVRRRRCRMRGERRLSGRERRSSAAVTGEVTGALPATVDGHGAVPGDSGVSGTSVGARMCGWPAVGASC